MFASIPSPSFRAIQIGPLEIFMYGILIAIGLAIGITVVRRRYGARGGDPDLVDRVLIWAIGLGFVGARLAYVSTRLDRFEGRPWAVVAIWEGGIAFFGGLTVGTLVAVWLVRRWDGSIPHFADAAAVGIPLAQAIGRWGNYFNQELFGTPSTLPWAVEIDPANRPERYAEFATFHPTFLYESLYNLLVVGVLLAVERRFRLRPGNLLVLYGVLYGVGRLFLELLRTDTTFRLLGLSRNGWVALLLALGAATVFVVRQRGADEEPASEAAARDTVAP